MNSLERTKKLPPALCTKPSAYELKNVVCDYGIFEHGKLMLILNDYINAENILTILRYDEAKKRCKIETLATSNTVILSHIPSTIQDLLDFVSQNKDKDTIKYFFNKDNLNIINDNLEEITHKIKRILGKCEVSVVNKTIQNSFHLLVTKS